MKKIVMYLFLIIASQNVFAWSDAGQIKSIFKNSGQVMIKFDDGISLNSCSVYDRMYNAGWIDTDNASAAWLSMALVAYTTKSSVRISGSECTASSNTLRITDFRLLE